MAVVVIVERIGIIEIEKMKVMKVERVPEKNYIRKFEMLKYGLSCKFYYVISLTIKNVYKKLKIRLMFVILY